MIWVWIGGGVYVVLVVLAAIFWVNGASDAEDMARCYAAIHGCAGCGKILPPYCYTDYCGDCRQ